MTVKFTQRFLDLVAGLGDPREELDKVRYETRECDCGMCKTGNYTCTTMKVEPLQISRRGETQYHHVYSANVEPA